MIIYILSEDIHYNHWDIIGVFSSKQKAEEELKKYLTEKGDEENYKIEEFEVVE